MGLQACMSFVGACVFSAPGQIFGDGQEKKASGTKQTLLVHATTNKCRAQKEQTPPPSPDERAQTQTSIRTTSAWT